jgi:hypothetical protein
VEEVVVVVVGMAEVMGVIVGWKEKEMEMDAWVVSVGVVAMVGGDGIPFLLGSSTSQDSAHTLVLVVFDS